MAEKGIMDHVIALAQSMRRSAKRVKMPTSGFEKPKKGRGSYRRKAKHGGKNAD